MATEDSALTPLMQQYRELKRSIPPNALLLFRLGDFYEMFEEDALIGSKILGITLTQRHKAPMAGIPHHAVDGYIAKLIQAGYKVAICDQTELARPGKIIRRQISKILSPGTLIAENLLTPSHNQYLLSLKLHRKDISIAWIEVSTGEFQIADAPNLCELEHVIAALDPREIIVDASDRTQFQQLPTREHEALKRILEKCTVTDLPHYYFDAQRGLELLLERLKVGNLHGYGITHEDPAIGAAGALILYVSDNLKQPPHNLQKLRKYQPQTAMIIDARTLHHLEILRNVHGGREHTLLDALDETKTAMGARLLERWVREPLIDPEGIIRRQDVVAGFREVPEKIANLKQLFKAIADIPRILTRISNRSRNPRELGMLRTTLQQLPSIIELLSQWPHEAIPPLSKKIDSLEPLRVVLQRTLAQELPNDLGEGGYIADGFDTQVDELRSLVHHTSSWLCAFENQEQARTGIKTLRVKYNNNFGYFIEVTKSNLHLVPSDYIRRQTTVNAERYTTEALKAKEREILTAHDRLIEREAMLFQSLVEQVLSFRKQLDADAHILAAIDVLSGWASLAQQWNYCRPILNKERMIEIREGRHPVLERMLTNEMQHFIANDTKLSSAETQIALITGPNMAGKSTYIRQVALITLMAQIGSFVPATTCTLGLVDRIFSRIGASDDLVHGSSTFMVEMNETANILNNATESSLIILDEIGRGTSTYDGLSLAWAIVEFLHEHWVPSGPRTLFATHYHELTKLSEDLVRVKNFHIAVKEWNDEVVFLHTIEPGASDKSYGIHVARLAGMPMPVIQRATEVLEKLESEGDSVQKHLRKIVKASDKKSQLDFDFS